MVNIVAHISLGAVTKVCDYLWVSTMPAHPAGIVTLST
jgi:hypothetical protein